MLKSVGHKGFCEMKRIIDYFLLDWKMRSSRKPLLVRGARQVGKTYAIRVLGNTFPHFVEVNLEANEAARAILEADMDPYRIVLQLSELLQTKIIPGSTLLFFDEIQSVPKAITALRYFYELLPELHVIAAGSLLDFAVEQVGIPVGRVSSLFMYPMSFFEYLVASGHTTWASAILERSPTSPMLDPVHKKLLNLVGEYIAIGGMPESVNQWIIAKNSRDVKMIHSDLIFNYQQDFGKYAKRHQIKYLNQLFQKAIEQLSKKFMFSRIGEYQKRELEPALELLEKAGMVHKVVRSAAQGIPIGAQASLDNFKLIFLDIGLCQALLKLDISSWFVEPLKLFVNKGEIVEAFVGQELLAYTDPIAKEGLFHWRRESRGSQAEIDYVVQIEDKVIPIKVKASESSHLKSMRMFLESHKKSPYGIRFSTHNYDSFNDIQSYPLYSVVLPFFNVHETIRKALKKLIS